MVYHLKKYTVQIWCREEKYFEHYKVMFGMVGNNVENVKLIGRRNMKMDANMKKVFDQSDIFHYYPYFNDAKELSTV